VGSDCPGARQHFELYLDGELGDVEVARLTVHLHECGTCGGRVAFERHLRAVVRVCATDTAPDGLLERVRERCRELGDC
jgi:mycothiol system anti-sigma-R factor